MKCKFCEGNLNLLKDEYICENCGVMYVLDNGKLINITCEKCGGDLSDGKCVYCENEIVIKDEEEEEALFCPECGSALDIHGKCKECGSKIDITFEE